VLAQVTACAFRFLRQPSRPTPPTPLASNSRAAGSGKPLRNAECVVYAKKPFGRPQAVLAYLARYTHQVAISNSRLISADQTGVTFK